MYAQTKMHLVLILLLFGQPGVTFKLWLSCRADLIFSNNNKTKKAAFVVNKFLLMENANEYSWSIG